MRLNEIQTNFKKQILAPSHALPEYDIFHTNFKENGISIKSRLGIYRNNVLEHMHNVLQITFPVVHGLVGDDFFRDIAYRYIRQNPPTSGDIRNYGEKFPTHLADRTQNFDLPYLKDVADYDYAINQAYYARDDEPMEMASIHNLKPDDFENMQLEFRDSIHLLNPAYAVEEIKSYVMDADRHEKENLDISIKSSPLIVYRPEFHVRTEVLNDENFLMLTLLFQGKNLGEALEEVLIRYPNFSFQDFLNTYLPLGLFKNYKIGE